MTERLVWTRACGSSACLEVAHPEPGRVLLRNSTKPDVVIEASTEEWREFLDGVFNGGIA